MAGTSVLDDIELIIEDIGGGGKPPSGRDGGDSGGGNKRVPGSSSARKYAIAIALAMVAILMFFMAIVAAFLVLRTTSASDKWNTFDVPRLLLFNTAVLLASSATLEFARKRLSATDQGGFKKLWMLTTALGIVFVLGQIIAWSELVARGIYGSKSQAAAFFYLFTVAHAVHLFGGICALLYVGLRKFRHSEVTRAAAAEVTSYYWHFMDGLWVFLLALLYLGNNWR